MGDRELREALERAHAALSAAQANAAELEANRERAESLQRAAEETARERAAEVALARRALVRLARSNSTLRRDLEAPNQENEVPSETSRRVLFVIAIALLVVGVVGFTSDPCGASMLVAFGLLGVGSEIADRWL